MSRKKGDQHRMPRERLQRVYEMIVDLVPYTRIMATLSSEWKVTTRQVENYVKRVHLEMREEESQHRNERRERLRAAFEKHYEDCKRAGEYAAAGQALDKLAKMAAAYVDRVEVSGAGGGPVQLASIDMRPLTDEQMAAIAAALKIGSS